MCFVGVACSLLVSVKCLYTAATVCGLLLLLRCCRAAAGGSSCSSEGVSVRRQIAGRQFTFRAMDCTYTSRFSPADWLAVVAVFVCASSADKAKWQFNGWPFNSCIELFQTYRSDSTHHS